MRVDLTVTLSLAVSTWQVLGIYVGQFIVKALPTIYTERENTEQQSKHVLVL